MNNPQPQRMQLNTFIAKCKYARDGLQHGEKSSPSGKQIGVESQKPHSSSSIIRKCHLISVYKV